MRLVTMALLAVWTLTGCGRTSSPEARHHVAVDIQRDGDVTWLDVTWTGPRGEALGAVRRPQPHADVHVLAVTEADGRPCSSPSADRWTVEGSVMQSRLRITRSRASNSLRLVHSAHGMAADLSTWLIQPATPRDGHTVSFDGPANCTLPATDWPLRALRRRCLVSFGDAPHTCFTVEAHATVGVARSTVTVHPLTEHFQVTPSALATWVRDVATRTSAVWGGTPVADVLVVILPVAGRSDVVRAWMLPDQRPTLVVAMGQRVRAETLADDWRLGHEWGHLGFPPVARDARWLDEGLATYLETWARGRLPGGEHDAWSHWVDQMPRGEAALRDRGMGHARSIDDLYWGGALFWLRTDLELRRTGQAGGIQPFLERLLEEGARPGAPSYTREELVRAMDGDVGGPLHDAVARALAPDPTWSVPRFLETWGVEVTDEGVELRPNATREALWRRP